jgi:hypothetical protein
MEVRMKKLTIILTGVFVLTCLNSTGQIFDKNSPFQYVFDEKDEIHQSNYIAINFIDTATKVVLKTFDIVENNPFNHLDYPEIEVKDPLHKNKSYEIRNTPLQNIKLPEGNLVLKQGIDTTRIIDVNGYSYYQAFDLKNFLIIKYTLYVGLRDWVAGRGDAILIYDTKGNLLHKLNNFNTDVREWALTENGRYFSYAYGGIQDESLEQFCDVGYKIMDLHENKIAYEENFGNIFNEVRTRTFNNMFKISCHASICQYIIINFEEKKKYSRYFTDAEINLWKEFTRDGLYVFEDYRNSDRITFLSYKNDFKVEDM